MLTLAMPPVGRSRRRDAAPSAGERANAWLRAAFEIARPLVGNRDDAAFVAAVRRAADRVEAAWDAAAATAATPAIDRPLPRAAPSRGGFDRAAQVQALGLACAAARRTLGLCAFDTQLVGARALLDGRLAEMATGEGKTLTVALAAAAAALHGEPVHVVTANDYLVARDARGFAPLYAALGLTVGSVLQGDAPARRAAAYACDITCVTAKELVFDCLRQSLEPRAATPMARRLRALRLAIVDEADSILIDEARVPLILSQPVDAAAAAGAARHAEHALQVARTLHDGRDFTLDAAGLSAQLTAAGREAVAAFGSPAAPTEPAVADRLWQHPAHREHAVCTALAALHLLHRERHYVVRDGRVLIVDDTSGRVAPGRAWSAGLHTLIELKEGCLPQPPLVTVAQLTYPRFFGRYRRLAGLSGTLHGARGELLRGYGLAVRRVPLRRACRRRVLPHRLFADHAALWRAVADRVATLRAAGRPVLVATDSVAEARALSALLAARGLAHDCLHADLAPGPAADPAIDPRTAEPAAATADDAAEAALVARAGRHGAITVATNRAGRGTDIVLDAEARARGGLHVVCCQLNGARRIDRQLAGRAARQGDAGSVETWLSLDNALLRMAWPGDGAVAGPERPDALRPGVPAAAALHGWWRWLAPRLPSAAVRLLVRHVQRREERRQREQRRQLAAHDRQLQRQLGFGGQLP